MAEVCAELSDDSSDSDVTVVVPQRTKRRRIIQGPVPITASVYSNKVNSSLKLMPDNLSAVAQMEEALQKRQGCEDLESEVSIEPPPVQKETSMYDLSDSEDFENEKAAPERVRDSSPSPPPTPKTPARNRRKGVNRKIRQMEARLQDLGTLLSPLRHSSNDDNDVILLGSSPPPELTIKVRRRGKIFRINTRPTATLQTLVECVASRLEVPSSQILLLRGDEELDVKETPQSLNLTVADIIDCMVLSASRERGSDDGKICLKVQGKDKPSHLSVTIGMNEPLQSLMDQYTAAMGLSSKVCFMFEGQKLIGRNTPEELGLESDDIIEAWA